MLAPICEETGWHGYGVDSLRAQAGMIKATLLFAAIVVRVARASGAHRRDLSARAGDDGQQDFRGEFLHQRDPCGDHRELVLLQE